MDSYLGSPLRIKPVEPITPHIRVLYGNPQEIQPNKEEYVS